MLIKFALVTLYTVKHKNQQCVISTIIHFINILKGEKCVCNANNEHTITK